MSYLIQAKIREFNYYLKIKWVNGKPSYTIEGLRDNSTPMDLSQAKTALQLIENKCKYHLEIIKL